MAEHRHVEIISDCHFVDFFRVAFTHGINVCLVFGRDRVGCDVGLDRREARNRVGGDDSYEPLDVSCRAHRLPTSRVSQAVFAECKRERDDCALRARPTQ